jgi:hypothetical protein
MDKNDIITPFNHGLSFLQGVAPYLQEHVARIPFVQSYHLQMRRPPRHRQRAWLSQAEVFATLQLMHQHS